MFYVVLYQPQIPSNTGNIIRLCANTGAGLHLIRPLGFYLDERRLRRAGLDYHEWVDVGEHDTLDAFETHTRPARVFAFSSRAKRCYSEVSFASGDAFLFGSETGGLPDQVLRSLPARRRLRIPMRPGNRCLNLANAVAVVCYEAWRQRNFGMDEEPGRKERCA
jgi:tRNA (cytidine/uridine-2'-O-)-methyltransferase